MDNPYVSVVVRDGQEIEWFECEKDAAAFVSHALDKRLTSVYTCYVDRGFAQVTSPVEE